MYIYVYMYVYAVKSGRILKFGLTDLQAYIQTIIYIRVCATIFVKVDLLKIVH